MALLLQYVSAELYVPPFACQQCFEVELGLESFRGPRKNSQLSTGGFRKGS